MKRSPNIPGYGQRPEAASGYGAKAPVTQWKDTEHAMRREANQPKNLAARIGLQLAWRVALPLALGTATDFAVNHAVTLGDDLAFSALYGVGINGGERLLYSLGSAHRENARRQGQRHDSLVHEATRFRTAQRNRRDQAIHDQGVAKGAQQSQVTTRLGGAMSVLRGESSAKPNGRDHK